MHYWWYWAQDKGRMVLAWAIEGTPYEQGLLGWIS